MEKQDWKYTNAELNYDPANKIDWNETARIAVLQSFLEAKLWMSQNEVANARILFNIQKDTYTAGRLQWCQHRLAAIKQLRREAINPYKTIDRYRRFLVKQGELRCESQSSEQLSDSANHSENLSNTTTVSERQQKARRKRLPLTSWRGL